MCHDQALEEGIGGKPVGSVKARTRRLSQGKQAADVGLGPGIRYHSAAHVMCRRYHRDGLPCDVDTEPETGFENIGEPLDYEIPGFMADIQKYALFATPFELTVYGPGNQVPVGQLHIDRIIFFHEAPALCINEPGSFTPQCL